MVHEKVLEKGFENTTKHLSIFALTRKMLSVNVGIEKMKPMNRSTPVILVGLLAGGALLFWLNGFFSVPVETWFAIAGMLIFAAGLLFGLFGLCRAITVLTSPESRRATGILVPVLTIVVTASAWFIVVTTAIQMKRSLDKREQFEQEHWDELHGTNKEESQQQIAP